LKAIGYYFRVEYLEEAGVEGVRAVQRARYYQNRERRKEVTEML